MPSTKKTNRAKGPGKVVEKGAVLKAARAKLGLTRRQVVEEYNLQSTIPLHEITLYKYENNELQLPRRVVPILSAILKIDSGKLTDEPQHERRTLTLGSLPYLDAGLLAFALKAGALESFERKLPTVKVKEDKDIADSKTLLRKLADGEVDLALFNTNEFYTHGGQYGDKIVRVAPLVRYLGYAVLCVPPEHRPLASFQECFNRTPASISRRGRLEWALLHTLIQFLPEDGVAGHGPALFFASGSDRLTLLEQLVEIARERADQTLAPKIAELKQLLAQADQNGWDEEKAFQEFQKRLNGPRDKNGAIFIGTLMQRLDAEERGANILISAENLLWLGGLLATEAKQIVLPTNCLLVNRKAQEGEPEQIEATTIRWNAAVQLISTPDGVRNALSYISDSVEDVLARLGIGDNAPGGASVRSGTTAIRRTPSAGIADPRVQALIGRVFNEHMIELVPYRPGQSGA